MNPLETQLKEFHGAFDERLNALKTNEEKQQFLEGAFFAFDAYFRYANPLKLEKPLDRELFMGSAKSNIYSQTGHLNLNPDLFMKDLVENSGVGEAASFEFAGGLNEALGFPLSMSEKMDIKNITMAAAIEAGALKA